VAAGCWRKIFERRVGRFGCWRVNRVEGAALAPRLCIGFRAASRRLLVKGGNMTRTVSRLAGVSALALVLTAAALTSGSGALATTVGPTKVAPTSTSPARSTGSSTMPP
jgi:hypothetical protein